MNIRNRVKALRTVKASELAPNPKNWRTHPKAQQDALRGILAEVGYADALLARELPDGSLMLVDGHLRAETTPEQEVPVLILDINEAEADKLLLSLDPLAALAETNAQALDALLREVDTGSEGLQQMYADLAEAAELYQDEAKEIVEDEIPEPPVDPITKPGDLWILGEHRVLCGDSTKAADVERLMGGSKADLCLTDPPYGLGDTTSDKNNYNEYDDTRINLIKTISGFFPLAKSVARCVVFTPGNGNTSLYESPTWTMAWFTPAGVGRGPWGFCCWQPILCYGKDPKLAKGKGCHPDALTHTEASEKLGHPCTKPIKLWCWLMERTSEKGEAIYEPFGGSGTTLIAAEQLGRKCYGMEISPAYCDVIVKRWETLTGKKAELEESNGQARPAKRADDPEDSQGQPRQEAAEQKRAKAAKR
jgi:hypothetical protein